MSNFLSIFCRLLIYFSKFNTKKYFRNTIRVSNSLDPGQAQLSVESDLDPYFLQRTAADDKIGR